MLTLTNLKIEGIKICCIYPSFINQILNKFFNVIVNRRE